jgi:DNA polymerase-1
MTPQGLDPRYLLVVVDLSWWATQQWSIGLKEALREGQREEDADERQHAAAADRMVSGLVGYLVRLYTAPTPACLAFACDSVGPTWRHDRTAHLPPEKRYKANRPARPAAYRRAMGTVMRIVSLHGAPLLAAEGYEADDVIATATERAVRMGLDVAILSTDKDHAALVRVRQRLPDHEEGHCLNGPCLRLTNAEPCRCDCHSCMTPSVHQWLWNGGIPKSRDAAASLVRDASAVEAKYGVPPALLPDLFAVLGDACDGVAGARGVGELWAPRVVAAAALLPRAPEETIVDVIMRADTTVPNGAPKLIRDLARYTRRVQASRETVILARELVSLRADAPLRWVPEELPVGGFDVEGLREVYAEYGFTDIARRLRGLEKRVMVEILGER